MRTATNQSMLGQILKDSGRITDQDIENALRYQREQGGYFGEALLALGLVSREELDWTLASQFDIPYVFPDADSVDIGAATLVSAEWALSNLTLPILRSEDTLNVIVHTPMWNEAVEELQQRTGLRIELALAAESRIRELIRHVHRDGGQSRPGDVERDPVGLEQFFASAVGVRSPRFGLSARPGVALAWYEDRGRIEKHPLVATWRAELDATVSPTPSDARDGRGFGSFDSEIQLAGVHVPVAVRFMAAGGRLQELVFQPKNHGHSRRNEFAPPPPAVLSEVRLLANSGSARFLVRVSPSDLGARIIHHLPALLLGSAARAVAVTGEGRGGPEDVLLHEVPTDADLRARALEDLRAFCFDAVSGDLSGPPPTWLDGVLDVAQSVFILWPPSADPDLAHARGVRWQLRITEAEGDHLEWALSALEV